MSDDDLIRRGDALAVVQEWTYCCDAENAIAALPAVTVGVPDDVRDYAIAVSEAFDTMMEVALNPFGAWQVIQAMAGHIAALSRAEQLAATNEALVKERDRYRDAFNTNCLVLRGTEERVERLEAALREIADEASVPVHTWRNGINFKKMYEGWRKIATERIDIARAALSATTEEGHE